MTEATTQLPERAVQYETAGDRPERTITQRTHGEPTLMLSEIEEGVFVGWDHCATCGLSVGSCKCHGGPTEKGYIAQWRQERLDKLKPGFTLAKPPTVEFDDAALSGPEFNRFEELEVKAASRYFEVNELPDDGDLPNDFNASEYLDPDEADELRALWTKGEKRKDEAVTAAKTDTKVAAAVNDGLDAAKAAVEQARDISNIDPGF